MRGPKPTPIQLSDRSWWNAGEDCTSSNQHGAAGQASKTDPEYGGRQQQSTNSRLARGAS
jgi:hypothetical protein